MTLRIRDLAVAYGARPVVQGVDLEVSPGEIVALLGPSGSGKTSILRAVSGLQPSRGTVAWDGDDISNLPVHRRRIGYVFQDQALFGHLDVAANIGFGLSRRDGARPELDRRVAELLDLVGLPGYERRSVDTLSGGEQQRVALARALAPQPRALLLDEPFGALDRQLRERLAADVRSIVVERSVATVLVTHDNDEAFAIADRVAVLEAGSLVQVDTPSALWSRPRTPGVCAQLGFVAAQPGRTNGRVVDTPWGRLPHSVHALAGETLVALRPDALRVETSGSWVATVVRIRPRQHGFAAEVRLGDGPVLPLAVEPTVAVGDELQVEVRPEAVLLYSIGVSEPAAGSPAGAANDQ